MFNWNEFFRMLRRNIIVIIVILYLLVYGQLQDLAGVVGSRKRMMQLHLVTRTGEVVYNKGMESR